MFAEERRSGRGIRHGANRLAFLESILENANDAVLVTEGAPLDEPGPGVIYANPAFTRMTGYSREEILGRSPRIMQGPDTDRVRLDVIRASLLAGEPVREELLNYRKDGTEFWVEFDIVPVPGDSGWPDYWLSVQRETTERRRSERERYRALVERIPTVVFMDAVDPDGTAIYRSPYVKILLGYTPEELSKPGLWQSLVHPDDRERIRTEKQRVNRTGEAFSAEYRMIRKDGQVVWVRDEAVLVSDERGRPLHRQGFFTDVTARRHAEEELARERNLLRTVIDSAPDSIFVKDLDHRFILNNLAHQRIHDADCQEELLGKTNADLWGDERAAPHHADDRRVIESGEAIVGREELVRTRTGEDRWWSTTKAPLRGPEGEIEGIVVVGRDFTERKRAEQAQRESEEILRAVTGGAPVILFGLDRDGVVIFSEGKGLRAVGESPGQAVGRSVFDDYSNHPEVRANVRRALAGEEVAAMVEIGNLAFETRYSPSRDSEGEITGVIGVATDVTERRRLQAEIEYRAFHDYLTGLPNRALFMDRLSQAIARDRRAGAGVAVLFIDLDGLKAVNDTYGHDAGDRVLKVVAERLRDCLRAGDTAARLGGDEFCLLLEATDIEGAERIARRILGEVARPLDDLGTSVTASIGIAVKGSLTASADELLRRADDAMYEAKELGGGRISVIPDCR